MNKTLLYSLTALILMGLSTGCKLREVENPEEKDMPELNGAQSAEFDQLVTGLGRPEQLVRMLTSTNPTWGTSDVSLNEIKSQVASSACTITSENKVDQGFEINRIMSITDSNCPIQLSYKLKQVRIGQPFTFEASFLFTSDTLANLNGVRGMTVSWQGVVTKVVNGGSHQYSWRLNGNAKLVTLDNQELTLTLSVNMSKKTSSQLSSNYGQYKVKISDASQTTKFYLRADYLRSSNSPDRSTFKVNGTDISKDAFESYQSKFGFLLGVDSFTDAG